MTRTVRTLCVVGACLLAAGLGTAGLDAAPPHARTLNLHNIHTDETLTVTFKKNGRYVPEALQKLNWMFRDWRRDKATTMDPALFDLMWEMHAELGSKKPINIISGYRSSQTNEKLRKSVGGQAKSSRHILGMAADIQFPDVPLRQMRYSALVRERGGVGYYPTSATPFVHVDTGRVRAWPRLPRMELALLFPDGRTKHQPAGGGSITRADARAARQNSGDLHTHVAAYHVLRNGTARPAIVVADAGPIPRLTAPWPSPAKRNVLAAVAPQRVDAPTPNNAARLARLQPDKAPVPHLIARPRLADRPVRLAPRPSDADRIKLRQLAVLASLTPSAQVATRERGAESLGGASKPASASQESANPRLAFVAYDVAMRMAGSSGWARAPEWDADHPDEASYRPFPLAPFLTASASADDPALAQLVHPDFARTGELFDLTASPAPLRLRPGRQIAKLVWAQDKTRGGAIGLGRLGKETQGPRPAEFTTRRVKTKSAY